MEEQRLMDSIHPFILKFQSNLYTAISVSDINQQHLLSADELTLYISGCAQNERESQKKIYNAFYSYAMSICDRYTNNQDDALEILNDGYLKIFKEIHRYQPSYTDVLASFKGWLRKIMVYTAIDHFRKQRKHQLVGELDAAIIHLPSDTSDACDKISYDEIIWLIQQLSPAYRTVLNLFIVEGYSHEDISLRLGISVGTSKSNLSKARKQLQKILSHQNKIKDNKLMMKNAG